MKNTCRYMSDRMEYNRMKKKILITGSSGFIGKNLKEGLKGKYEIYCPIREELDLLNLDGVKTYFKENKFDVVIHAATTNATRNHLITPYDILDRNLCMFFNLVQCRDCFGKMYYFGSGAEYDMEHYIPDMKESYFGNYIPKDAYGFSKYIMSKICGENENIYDLRLFGVYGKYEEWERRFISNAICRALKGMDITIEKNVFFDYLWIDDLTRIMCWFIEHTPKYKHYNVCCGTKIDLYSLAEIVRNVLVIDCDIRVKEPGWKPEYTGNNQRLLEEMGNFEFKNHEKAIEELCAYYKKNINKIDEKQLI